MIDDLRGAFIEILLEEEWMDDTTRQAAREKVNHTSVCFYNTKTTD
jgi:predicted metalloendopeptidase